MGSNRIVQIDAHISFRVCGVQHDDFRRLWDTGFLDDLLLDVRDGPRGKTVTFVVRERKRIQIVDYRGNKSLTTSTIEDELKK